MAFDRNSRPPSAPPAPSVKAAATVTAAASTTLPETVTSGITLLSLGANITTLVFPAAQAGKEFYLAVAQGGSKTIVWPGTVKWPAATAPTLTTTSGKTDLFRFTCADGTNWLASVISQNH